MCCQTHSPIPFIYIMRFQTYFPFLLFTVCAVILTTISCMYIMSCQTHPQYLSSTLCAVQHAPFYIYVMGCSKKMDSEFKKIINFFLYLTTKVTLKCSARLQIYLHVLCLTFKSIPESRPKRIAVKLHLEFVLS
jgi:hypothetical protein